jgi:putative peptidoglycan lipid II flippase
LFDDRYDGFNLHCYGRSSSGAIYAPGFHADPEKFDLAVSMFRLTIPYLLFMSLTAFASSILNSYGSFASPAFSPVLLNVAMIAGHGG